MATGWGRILLLQGSMEASSGALLAAGVQNVNSGYMVVAMLCERHLDRMERDLPVTS